MTEEEKSQLAWYLEHGIGYFLKDFFHAGNLDFNIDIMPHSCQSGLWYSATWEDKNGRQRYTGSMYLKLLWERIIKAHLISQREPTT